MIAGEKVLDTVQKGAFELAQTEVTQAQAEMELLMKEAPLPVVSSLSDRHMWSTPWNTVLGSSRSCGAPMRALPPDNLVSAIKESKLLVQK